MLLVSLNAIAAPQRRVFQVFGRKRHAVAVAHCKRGSGMVRVNGAPIETVQPSILRYKVLEPLLLLGKSRFDLVDIRVRVRGGGYTSQIYGMGSGSLSPSFLFLLLWWCWWLWCVPLSWATLIIN